MLNSLVPKIFNNNTYRFRILNADFDDYYFNLTFSYGNKLIPFQVIGADSAVRATPTPSMN